VQNSLTKLECPVYQTGLSDFGSSNSAVSFVKFHNHLFTPPLCDIKGLSRGLAGAWWASYTVALPVDHHVAWDEFRVAFRGHHLSAGTVRCKIIEFLELRQGNHSVYEYTRSSTTWHSTVGTILKLMPRRLSSTARGSVFSCWTT
jgi:hypothetical protein